MDRTKDYELIQIYRSENERIFHRCIDDVNCLLFFHRNRHVEEVFFLLRHGKIFNFRKNHGSTTTETSVRLEN